MGQGLDVLDRCGAVGKGRDLDVLHRCDAVGSLAEHVGAGAPGPPRAGAGRPERSPPPRDLTRQAYQDGLRQAREWRRQLGVESRHLERETRRVRGEEARLRKEMAELAARGQVQGVRRLAGQVVRSRRAADRLERIKGTLAAVDLQLSTALAASSAAGALRLSGDVLRELNELAKVSDLRQAVADVKGETAQASAAADIMDEAFAACPDAESEAEAEAEAQRALEGVALDAARLLAPLDRGGAPPVPRSPAAHCAAAAAPPGVDPLMQRLTALGA